MTILEYTGYLATLCTHFLYSAVMPIYWTAVSDCSTGMENRNIIQKYIVLNIVFHQLACIHLIVHPSACNALEISFSTIATERNGHDIITYRTKGTRCMPLHSRCYALWTIENVGFNYGKILQYTLLGTLTSSPLLCLM